MPIAGKCQPSRPFEPIFPHAATEGIRLTDFNNILRSHLPPPREMGSARHGLITKACIAISENHDVSGGFALRWYRCAMVINGKGLEVA